METITRQSVFKITVNNLDVACVKNLANCEKDCLQFDFRLSFIQFMAEFSAHTPYCERFGIRSISSVSNNGC
jgi:hypothetical protein